MRSNSPSLPAPGDVIRYAYLWSHEHHAGRKDRPCAVILLIRRGDGVDEVAVLPITSAAPTDGGGGVEIPAATRARLGLQAEPCWVLVSEFNLFVWPGPDLRPAEAGESSFIHGRLPLQLQLRIRAAFAAWRQQRSPRLIRRDE